MSEYRVAQRSRHIKGERLNELYWHSPYIYWLSEMYKVSSLDTETLSTCSRNIRTSRLTKLPIFVDVTERFFDEKR
jgi:hypothetical protein